MFRKSAIAIDIETIYSDVRNPNPQNPDHLELLCIGVGHRRSPNDPVETHVLFRRNLTPQSELELLYRLYEWVRTHLSDYLLTYNGTKFDLLHLRGRADRAERAAGVSLDTREKINIITEMHNHWDLFETARELYDEWPKLEEVCDRFDIEIPDTYYNGEIVENSLIPELGRDFLESSGDEKKVQGVLIDYTVSDIAPLFELADHLSHRHN